MTDLADALVAVGDSGDVVGSLEDVAVWFVLGPHNALTALPPVDEDARDDH